MPEKPKVKRPRGRPKGQLNKLSRNSLSIKTALDDAKFNFGKEFKDLYEAYKSKGELDKQMTMLRMVRGSLYASLKETDEVPEDYGDVNGSTGGLSALANV